MTFLDLLRACLRRWPLLLVAGVLTAAAGFAITRDDGVYWTRTEVVFLAPSSQRYPNALNTQSGDLIVTAGIVAKRVMGPDKIVKFASPDATIIGGTSIRDGYWARLPDTGGQWATNFATQELLVEIVGPTRQRVTDVQQALIARIAEELSSLQREQQVDRRDAITVTVAPASTVIYQVKGSRPRALWMTAILGMGLTLAAMMFLERRARARQLLPTEVVDAEPMASGRQGSARSSS